MTLKVGIEDVILARAVEDVKMSFQNRFLFLKKLYTVPQIKWNLISIFYLIEQSISKCCKS